MYFCLLFNLENSYQDMEPWKMEHNGDLELALALDARILSHLWQKRTGFEVEAGLSQSAFR